MRESRAAALLLAPLLVLAAGCRHDGPSIVATFDVQQLPPEPPAPPPAPDAPATPPAPAPVPVAPRPNPSEVLSRINGQLSPVLFDTGRWEITDEASRIIAANAQEMMSSPGWMATVEGHADERGTDEWNRVLGMWRAKAVKDHLRALGIDASRMTILSHGKTRPVAPGTDSASLARNRRVEIILHPSPPSGQP